VTPGRDPESGALCAIGNFLRGKTSIYLYTVASALHARTITDTMRISALNFSFCAPRRMAAFSDTVICLSHGAAALGTQL